MNKSQLDANTYGIGQLITQRKMFVVPEHQRPFAWTTEEIEQYLDDIAKAKECDASDYFVGLIVLQGPVDTAWQILDGQQRMTTTTMIYSAIREWLSSRGLDADSQQIEAEFIGVRQLGGKYSPRLRLNTENRETFDGFVTRSMPEVELRNQLARLPRRSTNFRLLEGALFCRKWVEQHAASKPSIAAGAEHLFSLAAFIENKVKVVCVEVGTTTDAYILFESLNDRGADLSALDLVKNYVFSQLREHSVESVREHWSRMMANIEGRDADDFLKVFWTSRFGVIQKLQLFTKLRTAYPDSAGAERLISDLSIASDRFDALDDPEHELWRSFGGTCRQLISDLRVLGNRQSRPLILAAMAAFSPQEFEEFLWLIVVIVVRYQIVGRGRTGVMEKEFSELAREIHSRSIITAEAACHKVAALMPDDATFEEGFAKHTETKSARVQYFLIELEAALQSSTQRIDLIELRSLAQISSPDFILPKLGQSSDAEIGLLYHIGNRLLIEDRLSRQSSDRPYIPDQKAILETSSFHLTKELADSPHWNAEMIELRGVRLANLAVKTWAFPQPSNS